MVSEIFAQDPYGGEKKIHASYLSHGGLLQVTQECEVAWGADLQPPVILDPSFPKTGICRKFCKKFKKSRSRISWREETWAYLYAAGRHQ